MSSFEQDEDYQVCDQCKETIYGEWVCYCAKCEDDRELVFRAAMALYELEFSHASSDGAEWNVATANAYAGLLSACRRAKEGE